MRVKVIPIRSVSINSSFIIQGNTITIIDDVSQFIRLMVVAVVVEGVLVFKDTVTFIWPSWHMSLVTR